VAPGRSVADGRQGKLFWRADLGIDLAIDDDNNAGDIAPVFRVNLGGGVDLGGVQLLGELVTDVIDSNGGDDSASTLAFGARFVSGNLRRASACCSRSASRIRTASRTSTSTSR